MTAPVPFVEGPGCAVLSGMGAFVIASVLSSERRWPRELVDGLAPDARAQVLAAREAVVLAALAFQRASAGGSAVVPAVDHVADSGVTDWVTSVEAARMIGVSERRVRQLLADGRLAGRLAGGRWQVDVVSVGALRDVRGAA